MAPGGGGGFGSLACSKDSQGEEAAVERSDDFKPRAATLLRPLLPGARGGGAASLSSRRAGFSSPIRSTGGHGSWVATG
jgi:hypothetical protein